MSDLRYWMTLVEGRDAPLYHWMSGAKASKVFQKDSLQAQFSHVVVGQKGVSLTRNKHYRHFHGTQVCLVFDQAKLIQRYRIIPLDAERAAAQDRGTDPAIARDRNNFFGGGDEMAEEFVIGSIQPLHSYLSRILVGDHNDMPFIDRMLIFARHYGIPLDVIDNPEYFQHNYGDLYVEKLYKRWLAGQKRRKPRVAESADFDGWFAGSKVVDAHHQPLKLYHGTHADFDKFHSGSHFGTVRAANQRVRYRMHHFPYEDVHGARVIPVYLKITNPLRVSDMQASHESALLNAIARGTYPDLDVDVARDQGAYKAAQDAGYDGLVYKNGMEDRGKYSYVVFDPSQVRSAITLSEAQEPIPDCDGPCLYHATFAQRVPRIMQHGLGYQPPTRNFDISQSVVYLTDHPDAAEEYAREAAGDRGIDDDIVVLRVDQTQLNPTLLHKDENDTGDMLRYQGDSAEYRSYEYHGIIPPSAMTISHTI